MALPPRRRWPRRGSSGWQHRQAAREALTCSVASEALACCSACSSPRSASRSTAASARCRSPAACGGVVRSSAPGARCANRRARRGTARTGPRASLIAPAQRRGAPAAPPGPAGARPGPRPGASARARHETHARKRVRSAPSLTGQHDGFGPCAPASPVRLRDTHKGQHGAPHLGVAGGQLLVAQLRLQLSRAPHALLHLGTLLRRQRAPCHAHRNARRQALRMKGGGRGPRRRGGRTCSS